MTKRFSDELWVVIGWTVAIMLATTIGHIAEGQGASWGGFAIFLATPLAVIWAGVWLAICGFSLTNAVTTRFENSKRGKAGVMAGGIMMLIFSWILTGVMDQEVFCWANARLFLVFCITLGAAISGILVYSREPGQILPLWFWRENTEPEEVEEGEAWDKPFDEEEC